MRYIASVIICFFIFITTYGQCPTVDFSVNPDYCLNENIEIVNNTTGATSYQWDFCANGDLNNTPNTSQISAGSAFGGNFDFRVVKDQGNYFGFVPSRSGNKLIRLDFGDSIGVNPIYNDLGNLGDVLIDPTGIDFIQANGDWFALISSFTGNKLFLLEFGSSLSNVPTALDITSSLSLVNPVAVEFAKSGADYYALIVNYGSSKLDIINFGASISATYTSRVETITGGSNLSAITIDKSCDQFYAFVNSRSNKRIYRLSFGSDLANVSTQAEITASLGITLNDPLGLDLTHSELGYQIFLTSRNGPLYRLDLGVDITNLPIGTDLGNLNSSSSDWAISSIKNSSTWYLLGANFSGRIYRYKFNNECDADIQSSTVEQPADFKYSLSGTKKVSLNMLDASGNIKFLSKEVLVTTDVSPDISFTIDETRCITNSNTFTSENLSNNITSYSWDLDGDGNDDSTDPNPVFSYVSSGIYDIRLNVTSDVGCSNSVTGQIEIYPEPPVPSFTVEESVLCTNGTLTFTNNTDETGYGEILSYEWDFNGEGSSNSKDTVFAFTIPGEKVVRLQSFLPGCSSVLSEKVITVNVGPAVDFNWANNCFGETIQFSNTSTGDNITGYLWDFGDGSTSVDENPAHLFALADTFQVSLTVYNATGCETTMLDSLIVKGGSLSGFIFGSAVENEPITFTGVDSTTNQDSVDSWLWDFDGQGSSTEQNPVYTFSTPGTYTIGLEVSTAQGCTGQVFRDVIVSESICPTADFIVPTTVCQGEEIAFTNSSVNEAFYSWDFCVGDDLKKTPQTTQVLLGSAFGSSYDIEIVAEGGQYYGFVPTRQTNKLIRLNFGDSIGTSPQYTDLGTLGGIWSDPTSLSIVKTNTGWKGVAVGYNSEKLYLLDFGSSVTDIPVVTDITGSLLLSGPVSVELTDSSGYYSAFVTNFLSNNVTRLEFGNTLSAAYSTDDISITGSGQLSDIAIIRDCDQWYGFVTSRSNGKVIRLDFGSSIGSTPTQLSITDGLGFVLDNPLGLAIASESEGYQLFVTSRNGPMYRLDLSTISGPATGVELGNLNGQTADWSLELVRIGSQWNMIGANFNGRIYRYKFIDECSASIGSSSAETPMGIFYATEGQQKVKLIVRDDQGNIASQL
ncbi:MAG: PKD repeat protein, partial [Bacteroidia bacterium]